MLTKVDMAEKNAMKLDRVSYSGGICTFTSVFITDDCYIGWEAVPHESIGLLCCCHGERSVIIMSMVYYCTEVRALCCYSIV